LKRATVSPPRFASIDLCERRRLRGRANLVRSYDSKARRDLEVDVSLPNTRTVGLAK